MVNTYPMQFNSYSGLLYQWNGTAWIAINPGGAGADIAKLVSYGNQTISPLTPTTVSFDTLNYDTAGYTPGGAGPWTYFTAPATGIYRVTACAWWSMTYTVAPTAIFCGLQIFVNGTLPSNGTGVDGRYILEPGHDGTTSAFCMQTALADGIQLNAGDEVSVQASNLYQTEGTSVTVSLLGTGDGATTYLFIERIS